MTGGVGRPLIGITASFRTATGEFYAQGGFVEGVREAGGLPVIVPHGAADDVAAYLPLLDALILTGGSDFAPSRYGGSMHPAITEIIEPRDAFEFPLAEAAMGRGMPVLGVCRGMQIMNVVRGGSIFDHTLDGRTVPTDDHRDGSPIKEIVHDVELAADAALTRILNAVRFGVNSMHHQAIDRVGEGFVVTGHAPDGVIEAIEDPATPFLIGVQWHPEELGDEHGRRLFAALVTAARAFRASSGG